MSEKETLIINETENAAEAKKDNSITPQNNNISSSSDIEVQNLIIEKNSKEDLKTENKDQNISSENKNAAQNSEGIVTQTTTKDTKEDNKSEKKKEKDISIRERSKDLLYISEEVLEKHLESITKILIPFLFVLMFIPGLGAIASALFLTNYFVYLMTSEEWKDQFKDAAKAEVLVNEAEFQAKFEKEKIETQKKSEAKQEENILKVNKVKEELSYLNDKNNELQQDINDLQVKRDSLESTLASGIFTSNNSQSYKEDAEQTF